MKQKLITSILLIIAAAGAADAQSVCIQSRPAPILNAVTISQSQSYYQDLLDRCTTYVSDLAMTQRQANMVARTGNLKRAAQIMSEALFIKASTLPPVFTSDVLPHTVEAIRNGNNLAQTVVAATGETGASKVLSGQVQLVFLNAVYNLINSAYYDLDARFFMDYTYQCRYSCSRQLPSDYYNGISSLAQSFLDLHSRAASLSAYDRVELRMSAVIAESAKNILVNSIYRRDYACEVRALHDLEIEINQFNNCGGEVPTSWFVNDVRSRLNSINLNNYRCY